MRNIKIRFSVGTLVLATLAALVSCAGDKAPLQIEKSLPQSEFAYYNDSFDRMREDLWDRAGYLYRDEQVQNFKQADMRFENGKLIIRTKTGSFSKGGLGSNFALRGDFDIRLDCRIDFLKGESGMDQLLNILVLEKGEKLRKADVVVINVAMKDGFNQAWLNSRGFINGRWEWSGAKKTKNFDGTLRILRQGKRISTFYRHKGASEWNKIHAFRATDNDMMFGFQLRNYFADRTAIRAEHSISAEFDRFRIEAADGIIEEEI